MQVSQILSQRSEDSAPAAGSHLTTALIGLIALANAHVLGWIWPGAGTIAGLSAMAGAVILGWPLLQASWGSLRRSEVGINELVSLAFIAAFAIGDYRTAGWVAFFMLLGAAIESRTAAGARAAIESLLRLAPTRARRLDASDDESEIPVIELRPGDRIRVRPGDNIPADGVVLSGGSAVNQANVTGESLPVDRGPDDGVFAGSTNLTGTMVIQVTRTGEETTLGKVRELILAAEQTRLPITRLIDHYVGYYTPLVLLLGGLVWAFTHDLNRVIATLVVSCPCAFVLATPTAMVAAVAAASRLGVLVKNVADLELAGRINAFVFDKTGTVTTGRLAVTRLQPLEGFTAAELLRLAAGVEQFSTHPAARAIHQLAGEAGIPLPHSDDFRETAGRGVAARIEGHQVLAGRSTWLRDQGVPRGFETGPDLDESTGYSLVFVAVDGRAAGWIALQDRVRPESAPAIDALRALGIRHIALVSGDRRTVAERVGTELGLDAVAGDCLPQDKVTFVEDLKRRGLCVAVVGDGVNDAPALAAGNLGIAMGAAGSEVAIQSASIALLNSDLHRLPFLLQLSKAARRTIHQNFLVGLAFIVGGLSLAMLGKINPVVAAVLHNAGSLLVVFNSARLIRQGEESDSPAPSNSSLPEPSQSTRLQPA
jgi:Cd2+/Zn2+-exporting ATPase